MHGLEKEDRRPVGLDLTRVQLGLPIGMPPARNLKAGLREARPALPGRRIARLLLCFHENKIVAVHGFIKKARKTPSEDLALARQRLRRVTT